MLDGVLVRAALDHPLNENPGEMNVVRVERANRQNLFDFGDGDPRGHRHQGVKVSAGTVKSQVTKGVTLLGAHKSEIGT